MTSKRPYVPAAFCPECSVYSTPERGNSSPQVIRHHDECSGMEPLLDLPLEFEDLPDDTVWPAQNHDEERFNDEGCTPGGWAKSPI